MKMVITSGKKYDYVDEEKRLFNIGKKQAEHIITQWKKDGKAIKYRYIMNGKVTQCYYEE